ncbi:hypothetical protein C8F01DRAFT_1118354 [Mycena amicta]|nr:hypothetical protein C8F01DRAFT_1118354 [Mycena amicta]
MRFRPLPCLFLYFGVLMRVFFVSDGCAVCSCTNSLLFQRSLFRARRTPVLLANRSSGTHLYLDFALSFSREG